MDLPLTSAPTAQRAPPGIPGQGDGDDVLSHIAQRCVEGLTRRADARAFLAHLGITQPATWESFGVGAGDGDLLAGVAPAAMDALRHLGLIGAGKSILAGSGVVLPTRHPAAAGVILGLAKLLPGQRKTVALTSGAGLFAPADLDRYRRVVLVTNPQTALQFHQGGCLDVAAVLDPAVLPALRPWLASRSVVVVARSTAGLDALVAGLGGVVPTHQVLIGPQFERLCVEARELLGLTDGGAAPREPIRPSPVLLARLWDYARSRLTAGVLPVGGGIAPGVLAQLAEIYGAGVIPAGYEEALSTVEGRAWYGVRLGGSLVLPAFDEAGQVVDFAIWRSGMPTVHGVFGPPRGLLAPRLGTVYPDDLHPVTSMEALIGRLADGRRGTLLLRGTADAAGNAARLAAAGVRRVLIDDRDEAIGSLLRGAGIMVEGCQPAAGSTVIAQVQDAVIAAVPAVVSAAISAAMADPVVVTDDVAGEPGAAGPGPHPGAETASPVVTTTVAIDQCPVTRLSLVQVDRLRETATFRYGDIILVADLIPGATRIHLVARRDGRLHQDDLDLAEAAQRARFLDAACRTLAVGVPWLRPGIDHLVPHLRRLAHLDETDDATAHPGDDAGAPAGSDDGCSAAHAEGDQERGGGTEVRSAQEADGICGSAVSAGAGTETVAGSAVIGASRPPADGDPSELFAADLDQLGWIGDTQAKRLVLLVLAAGHRAATPWLLLRGHRCQTAPALAAVAHLLPGTAVSVSAAQAADQRMLVVEDAQALRPGELLRLRRRQAAQRRPGCIAAAAGASPMDDLALVVPLDASHAQLDLVIAAEQRRHRDGDVADPATAAAIGASWRAWVAALPSAPVLVPYAERVAFPPTGIAHRQEVGWFFGLVEAHALIHHRCRPVIGGRVIATDDDFHAVEALTRSLLCVPEDRGSPVAEAILAWARASGSPETITLPLLRRALPQHPPTTLRDALEELVGLGLVESAGGGRGRRAHAYHLIGGSPAAGAGADPAASVRIRLLPIGTATATGTVVPVPAQEPAGAWSPFAIPAVDSAGMAVPSLIRATGT